MTRATNRQISPFFRWPVFLTSAVLVCVLLSGLLTPTAPAGVAPLPNSGPEMPFENAPPTLFETGLYTDTVALTVDPAHLPFAPQYPLWTDGADKRRWLSLPPGRTIDASDADAWQFPVGTRLWKEFSFADRKVETRFMQRKADGTWLFATYAWDADGRSAVLVSSRGKARAYELGDGRFHQIPGYSDCRVCHLSAPAPVLGVSARQLSQDNAARRKDRLSPALHTLLDNALLTGRDLHRLSSRPLATDRAQRDALGYLHGNCGHCHNPRGPLASLGMSMFQPALGSDDAVLESLLARPLKSPPPQLAPGTTLRVAPGNPDKSALPQRMGSRLPALQMPPLGTAIADAGAVDMIERWIAETEMSSAQDQP